MKDYMDFDCVPCNEECEQAGTENYDAANAREEAKRFIAQLKRQHGEPPPGAYFKIGFNPHDFGSYLSVRIVYDDNDEEAIDYAFKVENDLPAEWDEEAKKETVYRIH